MNQEQFLSRIASEKIQEDMITSLKKETLPLVMWGNGNVAETMYAYLSENGIKLDAVWVDGQHSEDKFHEIEVLNRKEVKARFEKFNVIMGHSWYELGKTIREEMPEIEHVFYGMTRYYHTFDEVPYHLIQENVQRYVKLTENLCDEKSVNCMIAYINAMVTGNIEYIFDMYEQEQTYFSNDIYKVTEDETFLDVGAYDGDTIQLFLRDGGVQNYRKIIAVEPDSVNFLKLSDYVARESLKNVILSKMGAWKQKETLQFVENDEESIVRVENDFVSQKEGTTIYADRLDSLFLEENVSLIKINYCDGITEALVGCEKIIRKTHPKLALVVGFDLYKVLELTEYIVSLEENYKLYLRFNRAMPVTLTLYAVCSQEK